MLWMLICAAILASTTGSFLAGEPTTTLNSSFTELSNNASLGLIDVDEATKPAFWDEFVHDARLAYERYRRRHSTTPDKPIAPNLSDYGFTFKRQARDRLQPRTIRLFEETIGRESTIERYFRQYRVRWQRSRRSPIGQYEAAINSRTGLIAEENIYLGQMPMGWTLVDVMWLTWTRALRARYGSEWKVYSHTLNYYYFEDVYPRQTREILAWAVSNKVDPPGSVRGFVSFTPVDGGCDSDFWAILGTGLGLRFISLMTEHKRALLNRQILQVDVAFDLTSTPSHFGVMIRLKPAAW